MKTTNPVDIAAYEAKRQAIRTHYTPLLKAMSASDPGYSRLWNERADALRALADEYTLPTGVEENPAVAK
jgi:glycine betaine/choline ABC-type transport system substrate-binding protein